MRKKTLFFTITLVAALFLLNSPLFSQNLLDNPDMQQAREYRQMAQNALSEGEYDQAMEYAAKAEEYTEKGYATAERLARMYRANTLKVRARDRIAYIRMIGAADRLGETFTEAEGHYQDAQQLFEAEAYEQSMESSRKVLSMLELISPAKISQGDVLPKFYTVKWGDCLWRIAQKEFIYGDKFQWRPIYEANKQKLVDPSNPHLIHPDQVFEIPSLEGETRRGIYTPDR